MQEAFIQFAWKMQVFTASTLTTTDGEPISIIYRGDWNTNSGPDFLHARIKIGDTLWVGNVEIHIKSSAWLAHKHHTDRTYDNVILHVVYEHDMPHSDIPTLALKPILPETLLHTYTHLMGSSNQVPCAHQLNTVPPIYVHQCLDSMLAERLEEKATRIEQRLHVQKNDWEELTYQLIARGFGTNVNADPFERVAMQLPYKLILKHHDQPFQIEALLFGQAGMLDGNFRAVYAHQLKAEYSFLKKKYGLEPIRALEWKFLRMRPANFPTIRMSQLAAFLSGRQKIFTHILDIRSVKEIRQLFQVEASPFWREHYHFKRATKHAPGNIGDEFIHLQIVNTFAPLLFLYGKVHQQEAYITRATDLLEQTPYERNHIVREWNDLGVNAQHAGHSQALLQLKQQYCVHKRCLECAIGYRILHSKRI
ncbi:MAG TPA: DUF2851 family protein [Chitinophagales bacterium]|nr:DUF2851 family protein [Chitinophagales bacterium]